MVNIINVMIKALRKFNDVKNKLCIYRVKPTGLKESTETTTQLQ